MSKTQFEAFHFTYTSIYITIFSNSSCIRYLLDGWKKFRNLKKVHLYYVKNTFHKPLETIFSSFDIIWCLNISEDLNKYWCFQIKIYNASVIRIYVTSFGSTGLIDLASFSNTYKTKEKVRAEAPISFYRFVCSSEIWPEIFTKDDEIATPIAILLSVYIYINIDN